MDDPAYRAYMKTIPLFNAANDHGKPWQLWVSAGQGKWLTANFTTYRDVWAAFVKRYKLEGNDPTITSRRVFYAPPGEFYKMKVMAARRPTPGDPSTTQLKIETRWRQTFFWDDVRLRWCGRCRRPVSWQPLFSDHHALRRFPAVTEDDNVRCLICGIRASAQPSIDNMEKMP